MLYKKNIKRTGLVLKKLIAVFLSLVLIGMLQGCTVLKSAGGILFDTTGAEEPQVVEANQDEPQNDDTDKEDSKNADTEEKKPRNVDSVMEDPPPVSVYAGAYARVYGVDASTLKGDILDINKELRDLVNGLGQDFNADLEFIIYYYMSEMKLLDQAVSDNYYEAILVHSIHPALLISEFEKAHTNDIGLSEYQTNLLSILTTYANDLATLGGSVVGSVDISVSDAYSRVQEGDELFITLCVLCLYG